MSAERRLRAIETALSPTEFVLRWLGEAHAHGDLESYVRSQLADGSEAPLDRLAREAASGARASRRGKRPEVVDAAVRSALRETVFRFELVLRINVTGHELLDREALVNAALAAQFALLVNEDRKARRADPTCRERFATLRGLCALRVTELRAAQGARAAVEERYLDRHPALFPDDVRTWAEQLKSTEVLADLAGRLAELDGVEPAVPGDPDAVRARAGELIADLVEPAKSTALEKLGESERARTIATGWLRAKLEPSRAATDADATPDAPTL